MNVKSKPDVGGVGLVTTERGWNFETPPPGGGLVTVTGRVLPPVVRSLAGIAAVNFVAFTNVVSRAESFTLTLEVGEKFEPYTVSVKPSLPAVYDVGEMKDTVGTGLTGVPVMVNDASLSSGRSTTP